MKASLNLIQKLCRIIFIHGFCVGDVIVASIVNLSQLDFTKDMTKSFKLDEEKSCSQEKSSSPNIGKITHLYQIHI